MTTVYVTSDDQSPTVWGSFVGNWSRNTTAGDGFDNYTYTATQTPGASFSFSFAGLQVVYPRPCPMILMS